MCIDLLIVLLCDTCRLFITGYKDGMHANQTSETSIDYMVFTHELERMFGIAAPIGEHAVKYRQPYAFFTPDGVRLESRLSELVNRVVFLFEGGQFIWPGIAIGHKSAYALCVSLALNFVWVNNR